MKRTVLGRRQCQQRQQLKDEPHGLPAELSATAATDHPIEEPQWAGRGHVHAPPTEHADRQRLSLCFSGLKGYFCAGLNHAYHCMGRDTDWGRGDRVHRGEQCGCGMGIG